MNPLILIEIGLAGGLAVVTILMHLEALRLLSRLWPRLRMQLRMRFAVLTGGVLLAHIAEIWVYAVVFYVIGSLSAESSIAGVTGGDRFVDYLYFSGAAYTSLGIGDVYPTGLLRLLTTAETLLGLLMIAWSAAFTYLYMQRYWGSGDGGGALD